jgi:hypothetical protein
MRFLGVFVVLFVVPSIVSGCGENCSEYEGAFYSGDLRGPSPYNGTIELSAASVDYGDFVIEGTWSGEDGHIGTISNIGALGETNGIDEFNCETGQIEAPNAFEQIEPEWEMGSFEGTLTTSGGTGTWELEISDGDDVSGTWSVSAH